MGRFLMYTAIALLALFVLSVALILEHVGDSSDAVADATVHDLRLSPDSYQGRIVTIRGALRFTPDTGQFQVVDADTQAVVIVGYDVRELQRLNGHNVTVMGRFDFDQETGIYISAQRVTALD